MVGGITFFVYSPFFNVFTLLSRQIPSDYAFESVLGLLFVGPHWVVLKNISGFWATVVSPLEWLLLLFCLGHDIEKPNVS